MRKTSKDIRKRGETALPLFFHPFLGGCLALVCTALRPPSARGGGGGGLVPGTAGDLQRMAVPSPCPPADCRTEPL